MKNQNCKRFLDEIGKVDGTDIIFHYKLGGKFYSEYFYT